MLPSVWAETFVLGGFRIGEKEDPKNSQFLRSNRRTRGTVRRSIYGPSIPSAAPHLESSKIQVLEPSQYHSTDQQDRP